LRRNGSPFSPLKTILYGGYAAAGRPNPHSGVVHVGSQGRAKRSRKSGDGPGQVPTCDEVRYQIEVLYQIQFEPVFALSL
jgi:hypothetical protein